ncbi:MAG TPA: hypothetical protein PKY82_17645 [Pyrinomonadaceae bacterium]|nr:hypothetical protein [Pyrinomonadaceae bacterium]
MKNLFLIAALALTFWTTACQKAESSSKTEAKTNTNTTTTTEAPKDAPRTFTEILGDDIKNLNKGLTPSEPCGYLQNILKKTPTEYKEYKDGAYNCSTEFLMINGSSFRYSGSGNKDYISVLTFYQTIGKKTSSDNEIKMLGLMVGNIADALKQASGQTLPKEVSDALAYKKDLKYVFNDETTSKPRAYQLQVFTLASTNTYIVMIYFE